MAFWRLPPLIFRHYATVLFAPWALAALFDSSAFCVDLLLMGNQHEMARSQTFFIDR